MDAEVAPPTLAGKLHGLGGFMVFPSIPVVVLVLSRRFRRSGEWRGYFGYSVATGSFCLALLVFFLLFVGPPGAPPLPASEFRGLVQRSLLLPFFTWMALVTLRAYRLTGGNFSRDAMAV